MMRNTPPSSSWTLMLKKLAFFCSLSAVVVTEAVQIGDECGIVGADFLDDSFEGSVLVAPPPASGCSIGGESECFCAPLLGDSDEFGPWQWLCNSDATPVVFGPIESKQCPAEIPVPRALGDQERPTCDPLASPTGFAGDPACAYSDCDTNATFSVLCGCIDLSLLGQPDAPPPSWYCLHSTCDCPETLLPPSTTSPDASTTSSPTTMPPETTSAPSAAYSARSPLQGLVVLVVMIVSAMLASPSPVVV